MTQQLKALGARAGAFAIIGSTALFAGAAHAETAAEKAAAEACTGAGVNSAPLTNGVACSKPTGVSNDLFGANGIFHTVANVLIYLVAAVSVIMLIVGGLRYVLSGGESSAVKGAKDTILYAIIGIVVAILAYALVSFVVTRLTA